MNRRGGGGAAKAKPRLATLSPPHNLLRVRLRVEAQTCTLAGVEKRKVTKTFKDFSFFFLKKGRSCDGGGRAQTDGEESYE